ncbi:MAG TPA: Rieske (2Fe-2S) protein [Verrucomicrobia bacterium]|nr:Rieske (2Fe-2S) protein [Verrucomicrobiales bacterium]HIL53756.1 Rieske (2Fe-2S) protein [Verrucomicrobiota bacterium]
MNKSLPSEPIEPDDPERRQFLEKTVSIVLGGAMVSVPVGAGIATLLAPLSSDKGGSLKIRLASIEDLPSDGTPKLYQIVAEKKDAWTKYPNKPIGSVFLRRIGESKVVAFSSSCPHAGCSVDIDSDGSAFFCPCHASSFDFDGITQGKSVSPRGLDALEVDPDLLVKGEVWVTFVKFKAGVADKVEV